MPARQSAIHSLPPAADVSNWRSQWQGTNTLYFRRRCASARAFAVGRACSDSDSNPACYIARMMICSFGAVRCSVIRDESFAKSCTLQTRIVLRISVELGSNMCVLHICGKVAGMGSRMLVCRRGLFAACLLGTSGEGALYTILFL